MNNELFNNIKKLCDIPGISGREEQVAAEILAQATALGATANIDALGNIIAFKKGKKTPKNKIMLSAHMDEVGFIITSITDEGYLRFSTVGGINSKVILGRRIRIGENGIPGVIGTKAIHQQTKEERGKAVELDSMLIDIGAKDKEDAEKHISIGDSATFEPDYIELGDNSILSKAIDDRAGCAILLEIMKQELEYDVWFGFSVQEEIGLRGARVASYTIAPDIAIVVESTASGDVAGVKDEKRVTIIGDGAVVGFMDRSTIYDRGLYQLSFKLAKENGINIQTKMMIAGGNDAGAIHASGKGVRTIAVSIPSKYIHSAANMVDKCDVMATYEMALALTNEVGEI